MLRVCSIGNARRLAPEIQCGRLRMDNSLCPSSQRIDRHTLWIYSYYYDKVIEYCCMKTERMKHMETKLDGTRGHKQSGSGTVEAESHTHNKILLDLLVCYRADDWGMSSSCFM
jgi:hypothetical protein